MKKQQQIVAPPAGQLGDCGRAERSGYQHSGAQQAGGHPAEEEEMAHEGLAQGERPPVAWSSSSSLTPVRALWSR